MEPILVEVYLHKNGYAKKTTSAGCKRYSQLVIVRVSTCHCEVARVAKWLQQRPAGSKMSQLVIARASACHCEGLFRSNLFYNARFNQGNCNG